MEKTDPKDGGLLRRVAAGLGRKAQDKAEEPALPERIGSYRVEKLLARGGMGEVYLAHDDRLGRQVAIKQIRSDKPASAHDRVRLRREAQAVARMSHPAIAQVHDVVYSDDGDSIVMQYVEGKTLAHLMSEGIDATLATSIGIEVAEGLSAAHDAGLVHRDLKAENIIVTPWGQAKILDFGLVKQVATGEAVESLTAQGMLVGTISVMSPEQAAGAEVDFRSDLFSFGILLYELFTGQSPFWRERWVETLQAIRNLEPPLAHDVRPGLPAELSALIDRLLRKTPEERPQSTREVVEALGRIAAGGGLDSVPKARVKSSRGSSKGWPRLSRLLGRRSTWHARRSTEAPASTAAIWRRPWVWPAAAALLLALAAVAFVVYRFS